MSKIKAGRINTGIPTYTLIPTDNENALKKLLIRASFVKKKELSEITRKYLEMDRQRVAVYEAKVINHVCSGSAAPQLLLSGTGGNDTSI